MNMGDYQRLAQRTSATTERMDKIRNGCMGLAGEAGECIDLLKKHEYQRHELNVDKLAEELGDVLWYCAELAEGLGISLERIAWRNVEKLRRRFPDGFSADRSINRAEDANGGT